MLQYSVACSIYTALQLDYNPVDQQYPNCYNTCIVNNRIQQMIDWKKTAERNIQKLSASEALDTLKRIHKEGSTISHPEIRALTGGFNSQAINFTVVRMLGKKAGICR